MRRAFLLALGLTWISLASCSSNDPTTPPPNGDAGVDAATPTLTFDPTKGSFAPARSAVDSFVEIGRRADLSNPDRFFPMRDPLFVASALSEVLRAKQINTCVNGTYGCPSAASANLLVNEYVANEAALVTGLKKAQAVQHAWGRIALAEDLLSILAILEQAKALDAADLGALVPAASKLAGALASPTFTKAGIYPELSPNAALYRFAFQQIAPVPAPSAAHLAAANEFIDVVFNRLTKNPNDKKAAGAELLERIKSGIIVQGIIVQGIIVQGSTAGRALQTLPYYITVGPSVDPSPIDKYAAALDDLLPKVAANTAGDGDWTKYAIAADELAGTFDGPSGALASSSLVSTASSAAKPATEGLEDDPNVVKAPTSDLLRVEDVYPGTPPSMRLVTTGALRPPVVERRSAVVMPAGVEVTLPPRIGPSVVVPSGLFVDEKTPTLFLSWEQTLSSSNMDHFDVRVENLSTKKIVFHKIYRRGLDEKIGVATILPVEASWFTAGSVNDLQIRGAAVDRLGRSSGLACASLAVNVDATSSAWYTDESTGKCFSVATDYGEAPLSLPTAFDGVVIGNHLGNPYRPVRYYYTGTTVAFFNDTNTPRRLQSLFTPVYGEILSGIDLSRNQTAGYASIPPIDTGTIPAHGSVTVAMPPVALKRFEFSLFDPDNGSKFRVWLIKGAPEGPSYW